MSIKTEIARLATAKENIKQAIEAQGVEVPGATTLDDYAELVNKILNFDFVPNAKKWEITLVENLGERTVFLLDEWLKENRNNENLNILIVREKALGHTEYAHGAYSTMYCNNKVLTTASDTVNYYGFFLRKNNNANSIGTGFMYKPLNNTAGTTYGGQLHVEENGGLYGILTSNYPIVAGTYTIMAWIDE